MNSHEAKDLVGCCGLYCGLCNKYQSQAPSRCTGCKLGEQHAWCSIWNCCVQKHQIELCSECEAIFGCQIHTRRKVAAWIPAAHNLRQIKEAGLELWLDEQIERQALVEVLLQDYNEGRSMSYYCKVCASLPVALINQAIQETRGKLLSEKVDLADKKRKAKILKAAIQDLESRAAIQADGSVCKTCQPVQYRPM